MPDTHRVRFLPGEFLLMRLQQITAFRGRPQRFAKYDAMRPAAVGYACTLPA
jgi:hypothetical protein